MSAEQNINLPDHQALEKQVSIHLQSLLHLCFLDKIEKENQVRLCAGFSLK